MKNYVFKCHVCYEFDITTNPCYLMNSDKNLFGESTHCPIDGKKDAKFELVGTSRGINKIEVIPEAIRRLQEAL